MKVLEVKKDSWLSQLKMKSSQETVVKWINFVIMSLCSTCKLIWLLYRIATVFTPTSSVLELAETSERKGLTQQRNAYDKLRFSVATISLVSDQIRDIVDLLSFHIDVNSFWCEISHRNKRISITVSVTPHLWNIA